MQTLLSVVIPCYNCKNTIERCLNSVPDDKIIQIITINDCSEDTTDAIIKKIKGRRKNEFVVIDNVRNKGAGESRNEGLKYVKGEYILFLDSDDYLAHEFMNEVKDLLYSKEYDCISFDAVEKHDRKYKRLHMYFTSSCHTGIIPQTEAIVYMRGGVWGELFRSSIIKENHITFPDITTSEDQVFVKTALAYCRKIYHINKPLYIYVYMPNSLIHSGKNYSLKDEMMSYKLIKKNIGENYPNEVNSIYFLGILYGSTINRIKSGDKIKNCKRFFEKYKQNYQRPDIYYSGYALRYRLSYRLFSLGAFILFKMAVRHF